MSGPLICPDTRSLGKSVSDSLGNALPLILTDSNVASHCLPVLIASCPELAGAEIIETDPGEEQKTLEVAAQIWSRLLELHAGSNTCVICLGGGMITDLGAFVASVYKRGIPFIHIPTSLLAMVDAAIGGKTGINHDDVKNTIGTFAHPQATIIHEGFLSSLPGKELNAGVAEMLKHGLIRDTVLWEELIDLPEWNAETVAPSISRAIAVKVSVTREDPHEKKLRKILNFGHTFGHAIESWSLRSGQPLLHGEAVALGMMAELKLSTAMCGLEPAFAKMAIDLLRRRYAPPFPMPGFEVLTSDLLNDKKNRGSGDLHFALISTPGAAIPEVLVSLEQAAAAWNDVFSA